MIIASASFICFHVFRSSYVSSSAFPFVAICFRSCVFFFCLSVLWLLLLSSSLSSITFPFSAIRFCALWFLFVSFRSSALSSVFFFRFFCLIVFFSLLLSLLLSVFCILLCLSIFCLLLFVSIFFYIGLNNSALVFCLHKKKEWRFIHRH